MQKILIPFAEVPQLSATDKAYAADDPALQLFFVHKQELEALEEVVKKRASFETPGDLLEKVLTDQYRDLPATEAVMQNVEALAATNTWTVTTAHQPVLFTGPLYVIYKAVTTINTAKAAEQQLGPGHRVVPVFVIGSEDHDLDELNHANVFGNTLSWNPGLQGPVGTMPTDTLKAVLDELKEILGNSDSATALYERIEGAYAPGQTFAQATRRMLHEVFGQHGLVVLTMEHPELKRRFIPIMRDELLNQTSFKLVSESIEKLEEKGFKAQATPREINLFYMKPGMRERIVWEDEQYKVLNTDLVFSKEEMLAELEAYPEHFSPNVILRPLYQEIILPNLAYVGGGGELAYWLERRAQFEHYNVPYPMLVRRHSVLWIDKTTSKRRIKLGFEHIQLFEEEDLLVRQYVESNAETEISLAEEVEQIKALYDHLSLKAESIDPTLKKAVLADGVKAQSAMSQWESRLMRAEKQRHETAINQIRSTKDKLFPGNNGLQERSENVIPYLLKHGEQFAGSLLENLRPFEQGFVVLEEAD